MKHLFLLSAFLVLAACGQKRAPLTFYGSDAVPVEVPVDSAVAEAEEVAEAPVTGEAGSVVSVPFTEQGGVKFIDVNLNGTIGIPMILDSGCSTTLISVAEARYLIERGVLSMDDVKGTTQAQIADGSIVENMVINLRQVVIGGSIVCTNVEATVSGNSGAPLLLGNEVLNRAASYTVDNDRHLIHFTLR